MADFASGTNSQRLDTPSRHHLVLLKGDHAWTFRWFDWFDAAMMRHQLCEFMNGTTGNHDSLQ
jgi:hypothetical protein